MKSTSIRNPFTVLMTFMAVATIILINVTLLKEVIYFPKIQTEELIIPKTPYFAGNDEPAEGSYIEVGTKRTKKLINLDRQTFQNREKYPKCSFLKVTDQRRDTSGPPVPLLFISAGRSGSSNTWMTLSYLAGGVVNLGKEHLGSTPAQVKTMIDQFPSEEIGSWWVTEHLCQITNINEESNIAGFQWKPYSHSLLSSFGQGVLKGIREHNSNSHITGNPKIKVLFNTRNFLDAYTSSLKHNIHDEVEAHCEPDDIKCIEQHHIKVTIPPDTLIKKMRNRKLEVDEAERTLKELGIDYYSTSYEKLYFGRDTSEWKNIMSYLGYPVNDDFTMEDVEAAFPFGKTSTSSRKEKISNYWVVKGILEGTEFESLLLEDED